MIENNKPDEPRKHSKKNRKGKKNKKKRDKSSTGKEKRKGKGKKESRKKKHQEVVLEGGFLHASTALPQYLSQELLQPTEVPAITTTIPVIPTEVYDKTLLEMTTQESDSVSESSTVGPSSIFESEVTKEVDTFSCGFP